MTTLNSFYATANALGNLDQRRWALGAGYRLGEYARLGYTIPAGRALVLAAPQYANGLTAAALTAAYNAIDDVGLGGPPAFAPTDLSGLNAWYKADALALTNGAAVTSWTDSSTNARAATQATGANQPVFNTAQINSLPAVTFDGTNDYLATAAFASPTAGGSVFAVVKANSSAAYRLLVNHAAAATWVAPRSRFQARIQDTGAWQFIVEDDAVAGNEVDTFPTTAVTGSWLLMEFVYDQTNLDIASSGTSLATKAKTGTLTSSTFPLYVGASTDGANNWNGQIAELVYYNRGLSSNERIQLRGYLQAKYAL